MDFALGSFVLGIPVTLFYVRHAICEYVVPAIHGLILISIARPAAVRVMFTLMVLVLVSTYVMASRWILKTLKLSVHFCGLCEFGVEFVTMH